MRTSDRIPVLLRKIYTDLKNPASFSSPYRLYAEAKKINSKIKLQDVMDWLETQKSYTLHQRIKTKFRRRKVLTRGVQYQYQADLVNYSKLKRDNSGYTFVLSIIDCFLDWLSRFPSRGKQARKWPQPCGGLSIIWAIRKSCTGTKEKSFTIDMSKSCCRNAACTIFPLFKMSKLR